MSLKAVPWWIVMLSTPVLTMNDLLSMISHHGYLFLAVVCFAEAIGLPLPAALALLTAGAVAAYGDLHFYLVFGIGAVAMLSGDVILYFMGRVSGWALLGLLCRLSANPETCILRSAEYFYRRGKLTLLFAKSIPGINTMSPPLAGSMNMRLRDFLQFDALGAIFYVARVFARWISLQRRAACHHARIALCRLRRRSCFRGWPRGLRCLSCLGLPQVSAARCDSSHTG